jgi:hypothetical protein
VLERETGMFGALADKLSNRTTALDPLVRPVTSSGTPRRVSTVSLKGFASSRSSATR